MVFRVACTLLALIFLWGATLQLNDPDPLPWGLIYAAAAAVSLLGARGRNRYPVAWPAVVAVAALLWAAWIVTGGLSRDAFASFFQSFTMKSKDVEEAREFTGLLIIAAWMTLMVILRRRAES